MGMVIVFFCSEKSDFGLCGVEGLCGVNKLFICAWFRIG